MATIEEEPLQPEEAPIAAPEEEMEVEEVPSGGGEEAVDPLDDLRPLGERFLDAERSPVFEVRLGKATQLWESGKAKFAGQDLLGALEDFELGLFHVDFDELSYNFELMDKHREQVDQVRTPLRLNAAACLLKLKKPKRVIQYCNLVLEHDRKNVKALYRRAKAHELAGDLDAALGDLEAANQVAQGDEEIAKALAMTQKRIKEAQARADAIWKGKIKFESKPEVTIKAGYIKETGLIARIWAFVTSIWLWIVAFFTSLFSRKSKNN